MGLRSALRSASLGLLDQVPLIGSGLTRAIEEHWPSPRERAQAAQIQAQAAQIEELEERVARLSAYTSDDAQRERARRRRQMYKTED